MKYLVVLLLSLSFIGCSKEQKKDPFKSVACGIGKTIGMGISSAISEKLECKKPEAIQDSIVAVLEKGKICDKQTQSFMSFMESSPNAFMCESIGSLFLYQLVQGVIPKDWECNPARTQEELRAVITVACSKIK